MSGLVTLTTEFEEKDPHVAFIKGVLCSRCPGLSIVDLTHRIGRQNVLEAALYVAGSVPYFPDDTVHMVCVADGPSSIAVSVDNQYIVCPDNGIVSLLANKIPLSEVRRISNPDLQLTHSGQVYYGRDLFAPVAAHLASGGAFSDVGEVIENVKELNFPWAAKEGKLIKGQVIYVDHFGNLMTNISENALSGINADVVEVGGFPIHGISETFSDAEVGTPLALIGSAGLLEIAYNGDRADTRLNAKIGNTVVITF
jgi:S-adenosyl-L-methionine hydrolase (adenosine-forming)